jgi:HD-like signal output (HDOD) protein
VPVTARRVERPPEGLTDGDTASLYGAGTVRTLAPGASLGAEAAAGACYVVLEGALDLAASVDGSRVDLGTVVKGECFGPDGGAGGDRLACAATAREATTVVEVNPAVLELLPAPTQRALGRLAASTAATRLAGLAARHAGLAARNARLVAAVKARAADGGRALASARLREALAGIPRLPVHATDLAFKLLDERTHADEVVASIKNDPALASLVLKRVNSAYYALDTKVSDYYRAVLLLGTNAVYHLILESAVESVMPAEPAAREVQVRAHLMSAIAYEVALASRRVHPLFASTVGLLHNLGESVAMHLRRTHPDAAAAADGMEGPALGAAVLAAWGLPARVHEVVERQRLPELLLPAELGEHVDALAVLHVARACGHLIAGEVAPPAHAAEYLAELGLGRAGCAAFCRDTVGPALMRSAHRLPAAVRARLVPAPAASSVSGR